MPDRLPFSAAFRPRLNEGVVEFPVHHMRGGTSTGLVLWERFAPRRQALREELLRHLMGVPLSGRLAGNRQTTGLGRGPATSNKVFFADVERGALVSTLAQLTNEHGDIDWSVNCGNMSSALQLWALDAGLVKADIDAGGRIDLDIRNTNTGIVTTSRMTKLPAGGFAAAAIPGVDGAYPAVDLFLHAPVGAKTGKLLPTGSARDAIEGFRVSCVDVAVPMVIVDAAEFGKSGHEPIQALEADPVFMRQLRAVWIAAGLRMGLQRRDGKPMTRDDLERSETIPKACIVGAPRAGGNIAVRYFTPQTGHASMAVSGGCCLAAAVLIPGTVAHEIAQGMTQGLALPDNETQDDAPYGEIRIGIENPAGCLDATIVARHDAAGLQIRSAAYRRNTQILLRGHVPLYRASAALTDALLAGS